MPELPHLDLSRPTETTRRELYDRLVRIQNAPDAQEPSPLFDPDAAGLTVFYVLGRWFATWIDLEAPLQWPEARRRELVTIGPADTPDGIVLHEV
jgi:hypothetical protein